MRLGVYFEGALAGEIEQTASGAMQFRYTDSYLSDPGNFALSFSLPKSERIYTNEADYFFGNYLPEGPIRQAICDRHKISINNDFELLRRIGGECAGALVISETPPETKLYRYKDLKADELLRHVSRDCVYAFMTEEPTMRLSLAGAQDKLPILLGAGNAIKLPLGVAPSTHILKFGNERFKGLVLNECYVTNLARALGLEVVGAELMPVGKDFFLVIKRYDRIQEENGKITRLHQEDMCQALGVSYRTKYESEGGPSFTQIYQLVTKASDTPLMDNRKLLQWQMVNCLVGNCDGHAKNLSLLRSTDGEWTLSPFYDFVCTTVYPNLSKDLAMSIGGTQNLGNLEPAHWKRLAVELGIGQKLIQMMAAELWEIFPRALVRTHEVLTGRYGEPALFRRIYETLTKSHSRMKRRLRIG